MHEWHIHRHRSYHSPRTSALLCPAYFDCSAIAAPSSALMIFAVVVLGLLGCLGGGGEPRTGAVPRGPGRLGGRPVPRRRRPDPDRARPACRATPGPSRVHGIAVASDGGASGGDDRGDGGGRLDDGDSAQRCLDGGPTAGSHVIRRRPTGRPGAAPAMRTGRLSGLTHRQGKRQRFKL